MPKFIYDAVTREGATVSGEIEAVSPDAVVAELSSAGMTPVAIRSSSSWPAFRLGRPERRLTDLDTALLTRKLAALLRAGLTLDRGLAIARDLADDPVQRRLIDDLLQRIKAGAALSETLGHHEVFSPEYIGMVRAGEFSGALPDTLNRLAQLLERRLAIRERLASALTYPAILLVMMLATLIVIVAVVLPRLESLFAEAQADLPWATKAVLACGHFLQDYGWLLLALLFVSLAGAVRMLKRAPTRLAVDRFLLGARAIGRFIGTMEFARFARVLGTLLAGGVALSTACRLTLPSVRNLALKEGLQAALSRIREGASLSDALAGLPTTPPLLSSLVIVGQQTGQLDRMLVEAADLLDSELYTRTERYLALLVPTLTIVMGLLVAALIGSVLVGILSVNELAL
jgi:general secretion pathway protein F